MQEWQAVAATRDSHAAEIILSHVLAQGRKALIVYGAAHLDRTDSWERELRAVLAAADPDGPWSGDDATLRDLVEEEYPGSLFVAQTYQGFQDEECTRRFEDAMSDWPAPALAMSVRGTKLERAMRECLTVRDPSQMRFPPSIPAEVQDRVRAIIAANADRDRPLLADSVIFIARAADLTVATPFIELALDESWLAELGRRYELMTGRPRPATWDRSFASAPAPYEGRD